MILIIFCKLYSILSIKLLILKINFSIIKKWFISFTSLIFSCTTLYAPCQLVTPLNDKSATKMKTPAGRLCRIPKVKCKPYTTCIDIPKHCIQDIMEVIPNRDPQQLLGHKKLFLQDKCHELLSYT